MLLLLVLLGFLLSSVSVGSCSFITIIPNKGAIRNEGLDDDNVLDFLEEHIVFGAGLFKWQFDVSEELLKDTADLAIGENRVDFEDIVNGLQDFFGLYLFNDDAVQDGVFIQGDDDKFNDVNDLLANFVLEDVALGKVCFNYPKVLEDAKIVDPKRTYAIAFGVLASLLGGVAFMGFYFFTTIIKRGVVVGWWIVRIILSFATLFQFLTLYMASGEACGVNGIYQYVECELGEGGILAIVAGCFYAIATILCWLVKPPSAPMCSIANGYHEATTEKESLVAPATASASQANVEEVEVQVQQSVPDQGPHFAQVQVLQAVVEPPVLPDFKDQARSAATRHHAQQPSPMEPLEP